MLINRFRVNLQLDALRGRNLREHPSHPFLKFRQRLRLGDQPPRKFLRPKEVPDFHGLQTGIQPAG